MFELGLKLLDKLIELIRERDKLALSQLKERQELFNYFIEPIYKDMELIQTNYYSILFTIQQRLADPNVELKSTIEELRHLRKEMEPLRVKTRVLSLKLRESLKNNELSLDDFSASDCVVGFIGGIGRIIGAPAYAGFKSSEASPANMFFDISVTYDLLFTLEGISSSRSGEVLRNETIWRKEGIENVSKILNQLTIGWNELTEMYSMLKLTLLLKSRPS